MTEAEILERLGEIVGEVLDLDDVRLRSASTARDVDGWDSVSNVEIMVAIERAFDIRFKTSELAGLADMGALARAIGRRIPSA